MDHAQARKHVVVGFRQKHGRDPSLVEAQVCQGVGVIESGYGTGWKGAGVGSKNWGAVQSGRPPCNPATSFAYKDTHPNPDGSSSSYEICFRRYADDDLGAADMIRYIVGTSVQPKQNVLAAMARADLYGVSAAMRKNGYYEGFGKTQADRIANHHKALARAVRSICTFLSEPFPSGSPSIGDTIGKVIPGLFPGKKLPILRRGSVGESVRDWQRVIGVVADGAFGPVTEAETKEWQSVHKDVSGKPLIVDGVVGPFTWGAAAAEAASQKVAA